jgi:hypothetical protein
MIDINHYLSTSLIKGSKKNTKHSKVSLPNLKPVVQHSNVIYINQWRRNVQQTNTQVY